MVGEYRFALMMNMIKSLKTMKPETIAFEPDVECGMYFCCSPTEVLDGRLFDFIKTLDIERL